VNHLFEEAFINGHGAKFLGCVVTNEPLCVEILNSVRKIGGLAIQELIAWLWCSDLLRTKP
jgi:hypothetical protein